jgi:hypothetical protein
LEHSIKLMAPSPLLKSISIPLSALGVPSRSRTIARGSAAAPLLRQIFHAGGTRSATYGVFRSSHKED